MLFIMCQIFMLKIVSLKWNEFLLTLSDIELKIQIIINQSLEVGESAYFRNDERRHDDGLEIYITSTGSIGIRTYFCRNDQYEIKKEHF